jgi:glycosyltransferase involved in cell wall biosynthesis
VEGGHPGTKFTVIPNAIEPADFAGLSPPTSGTPFPIGFLGRLDPVKRLPDLIDAVGRLGGLVHLHVFGDGRERPAIERQIAALGVERCVTLHGACARPQDALARVGLLVLPSEAEGFGLVLIEAMAAGVPVVATDVPGIRDVVIDGTTGILVSPGIPQWLASAIRAMVEKPWLRARMAARARVEVERRFAWPAVLASYRRLLGLG